MNILLVCSAGMSTSLLVKKMQNEASKRGLDGKIQAKPFDELENFINDFDVVLIGPQLKYKEGAVRELTSKMGKKCTVIPPVIYGMVDGKGALDLALKL